MQDVAQEIKLNDRPNAPHWPVQPHLARYSISCSTFFVLSQYWFKKIRTQIELHHNQPLVTAHCSVLLTFLTHSAAVVECAEQELKHVRAQGLKKERARGREG